MTERELFEAALDLNSPEQRNAFLTAACGDNPEQIARIQALLASHDAGQGFLETPALEQGSGSHIPQEEKEPPGGNGRTRNGSRALDLSFLAPAVDSGSIGSLGHFRILEILGQGYFGIVFKAFDETLHRTVALKVLKPELATTSPPRKRFLREARSAAIIQHENVVQIHSVHDDPLPYLDMEYIEGTTLQNRLDAMGPLELTEILELGRQIALGLAAAHDHGLIHRDIKSGSESRARRRVKITDFGLARTTDDASLTHSGVIQGTPLYMSPEQARGETLDFRSDLFSLGSVLYAMTTGRPPFRAESTLAVLRRVADCKPRPILEVVPETPSWLCDIISRLHKENPNERMSSASDLADLFGDYLASLRTGNPVPSPNLISQESATVLAAGTPRVSDNTPEPVPQNSNAEPTWRRMGRVSLIAAICITMLFGIAQIAGFSRWRLHMAAFLYNPESRETTPPTTDAGRSRTAGTDSVPAAHRAAINTFALEFDGMASWVSLPILDDRPAPFTVEAWVHAEQPGRLATILVAFRAPRGVGLSIFEDQFETAVSSLDIPVWCTAKSHRRSKPKTWHHTAAVVSATQIDLYLDGQHAARCPVEAEHLPSGAAYCIGGFEGRDLFRGMIDEVRISKTARYQAGFQPLRRLSADDETLGLYHCDEVDGNLLRDSSGHSRHGHIHNARYVPTHELNGRH